MQRILLGLWAAWLIVCAAALSVSLVGGWPGTGGGWAQRASVAREWSSSLAWLCGSKATCSESAPPRASRGRLAVRSPSSHLSCRAHGCWLDGICPEVSKALWREASMGPSARPAVRKPCPGNPSPLLSRPAVCKHLAPRHALKVWPCVLGFHRAEFLECGFSQPPGTEPDCF